jgi:hypothetical protein
MHVNDTIMKISRANSLPYMLDDEDWRGYADMLRWCALGE